MSDPRSTTTPEVIDLAESATAADRERRERLLDDGLRLLVDSTVDEAIFTLDVDGRVASWNAGAERLQGYRAEEIIGRHLSVFYPPDAVAAGHPQHELRMAVAEGRHTEEGWRIRKGGGRFCASVTITALRTPDGRLLGFGKVTRDLTEQRRSEERLQLSEERLRLLVDSTVDYAIFTLDVDGRVASWNAGAERLKGYGADEIIGRHFSAFYAPDAVAAGHPQYELRMATRDGRYAEEGWRIRKGGGRFWASVTITALRTPDGRLIGFGKVTRDLTERREAEERLSRQATHDPLTGLANRSLLIDRLQMALARSERSGSSLAVLFVDLDGFKLVNDTWGHHVGDVVLVEVARRLGSVVRAYDSVARLGGDEFLVTCEDCDRASAHLLATRLQEAVTAPIADAVAVSCSIGIAMNTPGLTAEDLVRRADDAMYEAKQRGRAQHRFHRSGHESDAAGRLQLSQQLRRAIAGRELALLYQPIVDVDSGTVVSVEALVRWDHPERGVLAPADFLPVAELAGLIGSLGEWVLETACQDLAGAAGRLGAWTGTLAVNVAGPQLADARFAKRLAAHLDDARLSPSRLCLETTEAVLVRSDHSTRSATRRLKDLGVSLAIDDFGTGYSSLAYLRDLSFDILKVDRTFTAGLRANPVDRAIVQAVLSLAGSLALPTVIEGVETVAELERVRQYGAHLVQGYLTGRPVPWGEACDAILRGWPGTVEQ